MTHNTPRAQSNKGCATVEEVIKQRDANIVRLEQENKLPRETINLLVRLIFGKSSEALNEQ